MGLFFSWFVYICDFKLYFIFDFVCWSRILCSGRINKKFLFHYNRWDRWRDNNWMGMETGSFQFYISRHKSFELFIKFWSTLRLFYDLFQSNQEIVQFRSNDGPTLAYQIEQFRQIKRNLTQHKMYSIFLLPLCHLQFKLMWFRIY